MINNRKIFTLTLALIFTFIATVAMVACNKNNAVEVQEKTWRDDPMAEVPADEVIIDEIKMENERISAGIFNAYAIRDDASLWGWGPSSNIGIKTTDSPTPPVKIMDDVIAVSAGDSFTMAIKTDGSLWAWGNNSHGQLGFEGGDSGSDGYPEQSVPKQVMDGVVAVSAGRSHTLVVKSDGSLWGFGYNGNGQLGFEGGNDGSAESPEQHTPQQLMEDVAAVSAGGACSSVIKRDGGLWIFGGGFSSYDDADIMEPTKVMTNCVMVSAGVGASGIRGIRADGSVWDITDMSYDYLQDNDGIHQMSNGGSGFSFSLAVTSNGKLIGSGENDNGQLGNNEIIMESDVVEAAAGGYFTVLLTESGDVYTLGSNRSGSLGYEGGNETRNDYGNPYVDDSWETSWAVQTEPKFLMSLSAPPQNEQMNAQSQNGPLSGEFDIADSDGYSYHITYQFTKPTIKIDTTVGKPGELGVKVVVPDGNITVTNTTPGKKAPYPRLEFLPLYPAGYISSIKNTLPESILAYSTVYHNDLPYVTVHSNETKLTYERLFLEFSPTWTGGDDKRLEVDEVLSRTVAGQGEKSSIIIPEADKDTWVSIAAGDIVGIAVANPSNRSDKYGVIGYDGDEIKELSRLEYCSINAN
jgi:alpha-tubulin suppressor-like RCC1 family protein